ncbi:MAG: F0F1 ATP synthase subunit A [Chloroflexota bacterium]|nr:MAG: F0F1 ATP synthase subunit A [Chloroflexota bacterium]
MNMGCGCSIRIIALVAILLLALFLTGFVFGPIGSSFLDTKAPAFLAVTKPHIEIPPEGILHTPVLTITNTLIASWLTIIVLIGLFYAFTRKMKLIPGRLQGLAEVIVEIILNFIKSAAGEKNARIFFPMVATIFLYVLTNAFLALLPFFGTIGIYEHSGAFVPILRGANTDINLPLSIALIAVISVEYWGVRSLGSFRYLNSFFNFGQLRDGFVSLFKGKIRPAISGILFGIINLYVGVLEVLSHLIRIISFTLRLFGNMTAGEILLVVVCFLTLFSIPIFIYGLELLMGLIQALIFAGLTLVFGIIALTPHDEGSEHKT